MRRHGLFWSIVGLALAVGVVATVDRYQRIGRISPGFFVMENLLVAVGGGERGGLQPFDLVRAMDGQVLASGRDIRQAIESQDPGYAFHYIVYRRGALIEHDVRTRLFTRRDFFRFVGEGLLPGLLELAIGALAYLLRPTVRQTRVFFAFTLIAYLVSVTYADAHTTYRFSALFLTAWAFWPATFVHLALTFPERRSIARRFPRVIWVPYLASAVVALLLQVGPHLADPGRLSLVAAGGAAYWGLAVVILVLALARASATGGTPLVRQRARVLFAGFAVGYLPAIAGTVIEAIVRVPVPHLNELWRLTLLFPAVMAYAMVRYDLFDVRTALRTGAVYSLATALVVLAYAGAIVLVDLLFASAGFSTSPLVAATITAFAVVALLNPLYLRIQRLVDRLFFRQRIDVQRSIEQVSEVMSGLLDLKEIVRLLDRTLDEQLHPERRAVFLYDGEGPAYVRIDDDEAEGVYTIAATAPLAVCLARLRRPVARERVEEDAALRDVREGTLRELDGLGATLVVPVVFQKRVTGFVTLGPKRSGTAYSSADMNLLRLLVGGSALALAHAKSYEKLEAANAELKTALRRVEILESIRANLAKFVPRTVQELIERTPDAPQFEKREADVSVLFVDIVGYTRLSDRLDASQVNELVERYFGAFLDEIFKRGGDVNETAGDGLMVMFQDGGSSRHARAAIKTALGILRRTRELNAARDGPGESIGVHVGVNSGLATVGATKIEGASSTRWTYTASGPVTNVAARLAALGGGDEVIVGVETRSRLGTEFAFEPLGERRLRNVETPVAVFRLPQDAGVAAGAV